MDPPFASVSREDVWRLHAEMKRLSAVQAEQTERLVRLERRQDDEARMRSAWNTSSPFPSMPSSMPSSTPQQVPVSQPSGVGVTTTHETYQLNLLGDLHLDQDDEPKRGASRANSVRFDESAIQGHWAHGARGSGDLFPLRTGSSLSSHLLMERSSSAHKLDGRQSSAGQSIHSTFSTPSVRANSVGPEASYGIQASGSPFEAGRNQPGMALLGPVPSIVRCWLTETFSHDTLIYAAVCTGSYESFLSLRLARHLRVTHGAEVVYNKRRVQLSVYLAEAAVLSSPRSGVPAMTVDFVIADHDRRHLDGKQIEVFLGSDALRAHNADILFSQNVMTLIGEDDKKLSVPLVRPEDDSLFKNLYTASAAGNGSRDPSTGRSSVKDKDGISRSRFINFATTATNGTETQDATTRQDDTEGTTPSELASSYVFPSTQTVASNSPTKDEQDARIPSQDDNNNDATPRAHYHHPVAPTAAPRRVDDHGSSGNEHGKTSRNGTSNANVEETNPQDMTPIHRSTASNRYNNGVSNSSTIWSSWRRDPGSVKGDGPSDSPTTGTGYQRSGRSRGTKVLRPSKSSISSTARSYSVSQLTSSISGGGGGGGGVDAHPSSLSSTTTGLSRGHSLAGTIPNTTSTHHGLLNNNNTNTNNTTNTTNHGRNGSGGVMKSHDERRSISSSEFKPSMLSSFTVPTKDVTTAKDMTVTEKENSRLMSSFTSGMTGGGGTAGAGGTGNGHGHGHGHGHAPSRSRSTSSNPVGGASAFAWLNGGGGAGAGAGGPIGSGPIGNGSSGGAGAGLGSGSGSGGGNGSGGGGKNQHQHQH